MSKSPARKITRAPIHPGEILKADVLPAMGISQQRFADMLDLSRKHVNGILAGDAPITAETAHKLGRLLGNSPSFWLNMQSAFDLAEVEPKLVPKLIKLEKLHADYVGAKGEFAFLKSNS